MHSAHGSLQCDCNLQCSVQSSGKDLLMLATIMHERHACLIKELFGFTSEMNYNVHVHDN